MIGLSAIQVAPTQIQRHIPEFQSLSQGFGNPVRFKLDSSGKGGGRLKLAAGVCRICYADGIMIEFSQPAQCLFCPQRRRIALLMKLVLAGSAAIITAIVLFQPGSKQAVKTGGTPSLQTAAPSSDAGFQGSSEGRVGRSGVSDAVSKRGAEILAQSHERFQEIQTQVRPLLSGENPLVAKAQKLLDERRREVLKTKVLTLGEGLFSESRTTEAERKLVLEALDKELDVLTEQKKLLAELK